MSERALSDWLTGYLKFTEKSESPLSYHTWVGISTIAGALQRKCYLPWGYETIYPNMYIVLVGPSGKARKGAAIGVGKSLLKDVQGVVVTSESTTREALVLTMKRAMNTFDDGGRLKFHSSITCISEELSVFLGQNDVKFLANLTDWYDCHNEWTYETKGSGRDNLQGLCFNLLGATAPDWLQSILPQEAVGGGFTSRIVFVVEESKGKTVAKPQLGEEELAIRDALIHDLEYISQLTGPFRFTPDGEAAYINWYEEQDKLLAKGELPVPDPRFSGYCERRATHLRKLLMVFSASRGSDKLLTTSDFDRATKILKAAELKMYKTFGGLGRAKNSDVTERVISYIQSLNVVTRSTLLQQFYRDVDSGTLKMIEELMTQMKVVKVLHNFDTGDVAYQWIGAPK